MKCLTICQPYAHLICTPASQLAAGDVPKRIENRTWRSNYRGPLLIHAGKSRAWLRPGDEARYPRLVYSAVLGVADLVAVVPRALIRPGGRVRYDGLVIDLSIYADSPHAEGPVCWVLENVRRFTSPLPLSGATGLFDVRHDGLIDRLRTAVAIDETEPVRRTGG